MSDTNVPATAVVPVKSAWASKVNWTQAVAALAMILTLVSGGKIGMSADQQAALVVVIGVFGNIVTWVLKTFFTPTVNPASLSPPPSAASVKGVVVFFVFIGATLLLLTLQAHANGSLPDEPAYRSALRASVVKMSKVQATKLRLAANSSAVPFSFPTAKPAAASSSTKPATATTDPIAFLKSFAQDDVENALKVATAQNNIVTKPCWTFIDGVITGSTPSLVPNQLGLATAIETALDDQALLASYFTAGGMFDQFNVACGPMINKINATIVAGGITVGSGLIGGPVASSAVLKGLTLMITGATAIPKL